MQCIPLLRSNLHLTSKNVIGKIDYFRENREVSNRPNKILSLGVHNYLKKVTIFRRPPSHLSNHGFTKLFAEFTKSQQKKNILTFTIYVQTKDSSNEFTTKSH